MKLYLSQIEKQNKLKLEAGRLMTRQMIYNKPKKVKQFKPGYYADGTKISFHCAMTDIGKSDIKRMIHNSRRLSALGR